MVLKRSVSVLALAAATAATGGAAQAQSANTTAANVNVLNLLSPFLTLNASPVGQSTLQLNLQQAIATNNNATAAQQALAVSDKNLFGGRTSTITLANGSTATYGVAANLAGGLPAQAAVNPSAGAATTGPTTPIQPVGGYGSLLGPIFQAGIAPIGTGAATTAVLANTATLLTTAYGNLTSPDLGIAKYYFANGTTNGTTNAVAPTGYVLPTANGLPNKVNSVYDLAYGVTNQQPGQDIYGSSRPVQVAPSAANGINQFDSSALAGLATNPSFPSGHTTYAFTDSILLGMLTPQLYQSMLVRASEYGNSRVVLGVHYPLDIIASRALASYDLAQAFTNPAYQNGTNTAATFNLATQFAAARPELQAYLAAQCGNTVTACAASAANTAGNPYVPSAANQATYGQRLTYGLPVLSYAQAPREAAPAGGPDASILLAPLYGGSTAASQIIAPTGGLNGTLATGTINQIIANTEGQALAAFYGTGLSYWTRINLYDAAGYFGNVTGTLTMASGDVLNANTPVTIGSGGLLYANGQINGATTVGAGGTLAGTGTLAATTVAAGGTLAPGSATAPGTATFSTLTFAPGSFYTVRVTPGGAGSSATVTGTATLDGTLNVAPANALFTGTTQYTVLNAGTVAGTFANVASSSAFLATTVAYTGQSATLSVRTLPFQSVAQTANQNAVGTALTGAAQRPLGADGTALLANIQQLGAAQGRAALDSLTGEGIVATQNAAFEAGATFARTIADQTTLWRNGDGGNPMSITLTDALPAGALGYAPRQAPRTPIVTRDRAPVAPPRTWRIWGAGFGGGTSISGSAGLGTAGETARFYGGALGIDYQVAPGFLVGIAAGGSDTRFNVGSRQTTGDVGGFHVGVYGAGDLGNRFYGQSSFTFSSLQNTTARTVGAFAALPNAREAGSFASREYRGRLEFGRQFDTAAVTVTPFVALEIAQLQSDGFAETGSTGVPGNPGLQVGGRSTASVPGFVGLRFSHVYQAGNGMSVLPVLSVAYLHEFAPERNLVANLVSLPGSAFLVSGARPARNAVQTKAGLEVALTRSVSAFATFDGEFADVSRTYAGRGGLKVSW